MAKFVVITLPISGDGKLEEVGLNYFETMDAARQHIVQDSYETIEDLLLYGFYDTKEEILRMGKEVEEFSNNPSMMTFTGQNVYEIREVAL
jgi:hypothetical protein